MILAVRKVLVAPEVHAAGVLCRVGAAHGQHSAPSVLTAGFSMFECHETPKHNTGHTRSA